MLGALNREITTLRSVAGVLSRIGNLKPDGQVTVPDLFEMWADQTPDAPALLFEDAAFSYCEFDAAANRYARWAQELGLGRGDVVALFMENRPEFIIAWFGLAKIGVTIALINTHLAHHALAHCIDVAAPKHLVLGAELAEAWASAAGQCKAKPKVWTTGGLIQGTEDLDRVLAAQDASPVRGAAREGVVSGDTCFYIFTSGTTGLPKAAKISHMRAMVMMGAFAGALRTGPQDRMYVTLPLYHSAGGICAVGMALSTGGSVVIRRKFSVHQFWDDIVRYEATLFQYIGEMCRYLLNAPPGTQERAHKLRAAIGNGLRPEIWERFKVRFGLPRIFEFYGATEGNVSLFNFDGRTGAVGRIPPYLKRMLPVKIVRFDIETEMPVRGPDGRCIECAPGEVGEAIGQITESPRSRFEGYTKGADTEKKILRDVFVEGDAYFSTGDLMKRDRDGYFYFIDRIGDTFRWKGENVATSEVAEVLSVYPGIKEANVYGVKVPEADGRAGMASLAVAETFDLEGLSDYVAEELPAYAQPVFLRLQSEITVTGTFKHRKVDLVREGFSPQTVTDPVFFKDPRAGGYVPLDPSLADEIARGDIKL